MEIRRWDAPVRPIVDAFNRDRIWYDEGPFSGLVTPSSVIISESTAAAVTDALHAVWGWLAAWQRLYADVVAVEPGHLVARLCEWGLSTEQIAVQRRTALSGSLPALARLDTVTAVPRVQVAEAQWKGGGEGFLAGVDSTYRAMFPPWTGEGPPGGLADMWASYYAEVTGGGCAVSVVRAEWVDADRAFAETLAKRGIHVIVATPDDLRANLAIQGGRVTFDTGERTVEIATLRCDRLADIVTGRPLNELLACADAGAVVLDPPPSYLCAEKLGMALPFLSDFSSYFSDEVRRCLIPTVLVTDPPECGPLIEPLAAYGGDVLGSLARWEDVPRLPRSLRRRLVVKCGSANPVWNQGGRGVWKLGGPTAADERVWGTVLARVRSGREAWVLEPYVDQTWPVNFYHPDAPTEAVPCDAHTRLLFYGRRHRETVVYAGGGANFSPFWKVSGKSARWSSSRRLEGSAFCDLRIA